MKMSTEIFENHRARLFKHAYVMLGRVTPAEDAVQETFFRWQKQEMDQIDSPGAFLSTIIHRICLDEIKSARSRKEKYIGPDLPEPLLRSNIRTPAEEVELSESLSMALHVVLDRLTPVQRAVFILREIFDYDYASIAKIINKSEAYCRKIAQRARAHIKEHKPQFESGTVSQQKLVSTFTELVQEGNISEIESILAKDAILYSDGGGKVTAARKPIYGPNKIARFLLGIKKSANADVDWTFEFQQVNTEPGMIIRKNNEIYNVWSFHIENKKIQSIYIVLNPDKLEHLKQI